MIKYKKHAITFITPTHNGGKRLENCLKSIRKQTYPKKLIDIIVIVDSSTDNSAEIAKKYGAHVFIKNFKNPEKAKKFALSKVRTEFFINADDDHTLVTKDWIQQMIKPLQEDKEITGSFTQFVVNKSDPPISRLLSFDPLQRDPIYMPFTVDIQDTFVEQRKGYQLLKYEPKKILTSGQVVYRTKLFELPFLKSKKKYMELDMLVLFVKHGYNKFAYVPSAKTHHLLASSIQQVCQKRIRNIRENYLYQPDPREFTWFDLGKPEDILKIVLWILFAFSVVLPLVYGVVLSIKHKDIAGLWYGPLAFTETIVILFEFLRQFLYEAQDKKIKFPT